MKICPICGVLLANKKDVFCSNCYINGQINYQPLWCLKCGNRKIILLMGKRYSCLKCSLK